MEDRIPFSKEGFDAFNRQAISYRSTSRAKTTEEFEGAAGGESSVYHDNFEYEEATRSMDMRAREIKRLEDITRKAIVIEIRDQIKRVAIGSTVELEFSDGEKQEITIGAYSESIPAKGLIAYDAPLAQSIIGKTEGDEVEFKSISKGKRRISIEKLHPASYKYRQLIAELFSQQPSLS